MVRDATANFGRRFRGSYIEPAINHRGVHAHDF
jgi:hypothetical protein